MAGEHFLQVFNNVEKNHKTSKKVVFSDGGSPNLDSCMSFLAAQEKRNVILNVNLPHWGIFFFWGVTLLGDSNIF